MLIATQAHIDHRGVEAVCCYPVDCCDYGLPIGPAGTAENANRTEVHALRHAVCAPSDAARHMGAMPGAVPAVLPIGVIGVGGRGGISIIIYEVLGYGGPAAELLMRDADATVYHINIHT